MPADTQVKNLVISDFSPGCYSQAGTIAGSGVDRHLSSPPGAADATNTWACAALPNKTLAALPGVDHTYDWPGIYKNPGTTYIVGCFIHDELGDNSTEAIVIGQYYDGSTNSHWQAGSYIVESASYHQIRREDYANAGGGIFGSPYPGMTRATPTSTHSVTAVTVGSTTTITVAGTYTIGQVIYLVQLPGGISGLSLHTAYVVTAIPAGQITIAVPTIGVYTANGVVGVVSTDTPSPVVVFPGPNALYVSSGGLYLYPDPSNRSTYGTLDLVGAGSPPTGQTILHNQRIICLAGTQYTWPSGGGIFQTNENVFYTDPPLSTLYPTDGLTPTILAPEEPFGYGAWGSISAGELFLAKKRGGAIIVTGDITSPTVTSLPGATSTGNYIGQGASSTAGFIYGSFQNGMWSWNGSNTSQKISTNLDDGSFLPPEFYPMLSNNYGFFVTSYRSKVYVNNNWLYDTNTQSWWRYHPTLLQGGEDLYYTQIVNGDYTYAAKLSITDTNKTFLYRFNNEIPAQSYRWTSLPLQLEAQNQVCDVRQIVLRVSCSDIYGSITLTVKDNGVTPANGGPWTIAVPTPGPQLLRFNVGAVGVFEPSLQLDVSNSTQADMPIIHSIDMEYRVRAHLPSVN